VSSRDVRQRIEAIIVQQDLAFEELRKAGSSFDEAIGGMRISLDALRAANDAQNVALDRIIVANREARRLLTTLPQ
jgi:hypothetical protein